jgi:pimeloyl-ACP methyl ester carboxylesterase
MKIVSSVLASLVAWAMMNAISWAELTFPGEQQARERLRLPVAEPAVVQQWVAQRTAALNAGSKVIETASGHQVEYAMYGTGPVVLCLHGGFGGYDQSYLIGKHLHRRLGFTVLAVSRPGYLRSTALPAKANSARDQAAVMIELLDALGIEQVAALGFSAGTAIAAEMAANYPDRVWAMVLECSGSPPESAPFYQILTELLEADLIDDELPYLLYEICRRFPSFAAAFVVAADTNLEGARLADRIQYVRNNPAQLLFMRDMMFSATPLSIRRRGLIADVEAVDPWASIPLESLTLPTMFIQAFEDSNGYYPEALKLAARMAEGNTRLVTVEDSGHFIWLGRYTTIWQEQLYRFLKENVPAN